jgi:hypothetical protein
VSEWQSIETAPKDGTIVLLTRKGSRAICTGHYKPPPPLYPDWRVWIGCIIKEPTHWMHCPEAPQ